MIHDQYCKSQDINQLPCQGSLLIALLRSLCYSLLLMSRKRQLQANMKARIFMSSLHPISRMCTTLVSSRPLSIHLPSVNHARHCLKNPSLLPSSIRSIRSVNALPQRLKCRWHIPRAFRITKEELEKVSFALFVPSLLTICFIVKGVFV